MMPEDHRSSIFTPIGMDERMMILATGFLCGGSGSGYDSSLKPTLTGKIGKFCTVQFRRDALGAAANLPVP